MILVVVEHDAGAPDRLSAEALTLGRSLAGATGEPLHAVAWGAGAAELGGALGVAWRRGPPRDRRIRGSTDTRPAAIGASLAQLDRARAAGCRSSAPAASAAPRSSPMPRHGPGCRWRPTCTDVRPGEAWQATRQRWGGSLLEETRLDGPIRLLTVAPHAVEPAVAGRAEPGRGPARSRRSSTDRDLRVRITSRVPAEAGKISLADARVVVGGGRGVGSAEGFAELDELAALLGGRSVSRAS